MILRGLFLSLLLFLTTSSAYSQHTVSGIISDKSDKTKLLEGVSIYIPEFNVHDVSKAGGTYIFRNIGIGVITLQFTHLGYKTFVKTINTKDSATVFSVELEPSTIEIEEVAILSNETKLPDDIPYPIVTYKYQDLKNCGSINLMSSLSQKPGIDKICVGNGVSKPVIRGLSFNRILLYQYGTRIDNQPWDDRHDLGVNENGVEKVEIIKGPAGLIYGSDAMGGTMIFVDEKPAVAGELSGDANFRFYSNTLGLESEAGIKGSSPKGIFYSGRLGVGSHTSYVQGEGDTVAKNTEEEDFAANSKFKNLTGRAVVGLTKKWGVSKFTYSYLNQMIGIVELEEDSSGSSGLEDEEQREREIEAPYQDVTSQVFALENTIIYRNSKLNINLAYIDNNRKEFEPLPGKQKENAIGLKLKTNTYDVKYTSDNQKKFGYTIGSQGMVQTNRNFGTEELVPDADVNDFAGYLLLRYDLPKWNFLAGGRIDFRSTKLESEEPDHTVHIDKNYQLANGSLGASFHPVKDITLKINGASGFTAPNYAQLGTYGKHEGTYRFEAGNPNLEAEQNFEGDLGVIWETHSVQVNVDGYYNMINNYIYIANTGQQQTVQINGVDSLLPYYEYRQQNAKLSGLELSFDVNPAFAKWVDLLIGYSTVQGTFTAGGNIPYIPAGKLISSLKFQKNQMNYIYQPYISLVLSNYFKQDKVAEFESPTDAYMLLDLHFGGKFNWGHQRFEVSLSVTNLLNEGYFNHLSLIKSIGVREMGRNVAINLRFPFGLKNTN